MANSPRLYFTVGPVQGFVAESRRTRDLWASSYLLSFLVKAAIDAVARSGGRIILPDISSLPAPVPSGGTPHGNLPNRFVAEGADPAFDPAKAAASATKALLDCWRHIAQAVWDQYLGRVCSQGKGTQAIWDRQVHNFWELSWAVGSAEDDPLPRRKNWRTTPATVEPGDHCTMMGQWQELSGFVRSRERDQQDEFWRVLREGGSPLDLEEDERLCAIAFIKRLAPRVSERVFGRELKAENWLSTPYLAAIPWLRQIAQNGGAILEQARAYAGTVRQKAEQPLGESYTYTKSLHELSQTKPTGDLFRLDGNFFHERALRNKRVTRLNTTGEENDKELREKLLGQLKDVCDNAQATASPFYALLLMDGDSMGALLGQARSQARESEVTKGIASFASRVPEAVFNHDGVTVYAGGDDLLALLAHDRALACAHALRDEYTNSFQGCGQEIARRATLSGALVYSDYHIPLRSVLQTAHYILDRVAKDATGRDSLAVAVWKGSGVVCQWAAPWQHLRRPGKNLLDELAARVQSPTGRRANDRAAFSPSFLYRLRELFASLAEGPLEEPGSFGTIDLNPPDLRSLVLAEYLRGLSHRTSQEEAERRRAEAEKDVQLLLELCFRVTRGPDGTLIHHGNGHAPCQVGFDGLRLAHFLATVGSEVE